MAIDQDMAMAMDDMATSGDGGASCDVATQSGCTTGQKCVTAMNGGHCVTDGTVGEGQACMRGAMGMPDNCQAGLTCSRTGLPTGMSVCRKYCTSNSTCTTAGQLCAIGGGGGSTTIGSCAPSCTPFGTDCPPGMDCGSFAVEIGSTQNMVNAFMVCKTTGTGLAYDACDRMNPCAANLYCDQQAGWCAPVCDSSGSHACPPPPVDGGGATSVSCVAFDNQAATGLGFCQ
jgi:hypothetical protein